MVSRPLSELASFVGGEVIGDGSVSISGVSGLAEAEPGELSFYTGPRYRKQLATTRASAVLFAGDELPPRSGVSYVRVEHPHLAFARASALFHPRHAPAPGISPRAEVHPEARIDSGATVMAGAFVARGAHVGPRTVLYPGAYVGEGAEIGADCTLYPNVSVLEGCILGDRVILHASCVIGADGFGFAFDPSGPTGPRHFKVPQVGIVRIEDDVEVGACSCVDRATLGETVIGRGSKIDNLVQIAHNVKVGPLSILCAQAGVSGSSELGTGVVLAGQVGVVGHIRVGDMAKVGAQSGVAHDVPDGQVVSGSPAIDHKAWLKGAASQERLPELFKEMRQLKRRLEALEQEKGSRPS
jgi:UDP-3-O-[3-hydroxymyristoyl] glucosamine N-acyltransferase